MGRRDRSVGRAAGGAARAQACAALEGRDVPARAAPRAAQLRPRRDELSRSLRSARPHAARRAAPPGRRRSPTRPISGWTTRRSRSPRSSARANAWAAALRELGVARGDSVAFLLQSGPEFVYATFGCLQLGAIWIPVNVDYRGAWLRATLEDAAARVLVVDAELVPRVAELGPGPAVRARDRAAATASSGAAVADDSRPPTSRSARQGRGARRPGHRSRRHRLRALDLGHHGPLEGRDAEPQRVDPRRRCRARRTRASARATSLYGCLPMYNSAAWVAHIYRALVAGIPVGLDPAFSVQTFWDRIRHYGATQIFTLGTMHIYLWQAPERADDARQPGAPRGLRADARSADRSVQEALRDRDARPGLRPERGARHAAPLRRRRRASPARSASRCRASR